MLLKITEFDSHEIENIVGKEENAVYQHFLLFQQFFQKMSPQGCKTLSLCCKELIHCQEQPLLWLIVIFCSVVMSEAPPFVCLANQKLCYLQIYNM